MRAQYLSSGGEQKNTFCLTRGNEAFLSQHIGDLDNPAIYTVFKQEIDFYTKMFDSEPQLIVHDLHPQYLSTLYAATEIGSLPKLVVQHHQAHFASVLAEHRLSGPAIGLIFDRMIAPETGVGISLFAPDWRPIPNVQLSTVWGSDRFAKTKPPEITSYGHNIELAWLYLHAVDVLGLSRRSALDRA